MTSADVAMIAGKPDLFHVPRADIRGLWYPAVLSEESAALVDGNGVAADFDARIVGGVGQLQRVGNPTHGIHRVPDTGEVNGAGPARERLLETFRQIESIVGAIV